MATISVYIDDGSEIPVDLSLITPDTTPCGYLYNRVTKDMHNALAISTDHVLLNSVLEKAGVTTPYDYLKFWVDEGSGPVPYTAYDPSAFTYAKLNPDRGYFNAAESGVEPADLYKGSFTGVPTVIALNQASGTIPDGEISGDADSGYFLDLLPDVSTDQTPRLFWGLNETNDGEFSGSRFPSVIVRIYVYTT
jgi:hypothetical protein